MSSIAMPVFLLFVVFVLTGCGNPLKTLPSVSDDNLLLPKVNKDGEEIVSPEAAVICDTITSQDNVFGVIKSITVYDRKDNTSTKQRSAVYAEVHTDTAYATYTYYLKIGMVYNKEEKAWKTELVENDPAKEFTMEVTTFADDATIMTDLSENEYSFYFEDVDSYEKPENIMALTIDSVSCNMIDEYRAGCTYDVTFTMRDGFYYYDGTGKVTYIYYRPDYYGEECIDYYGCDVSLMNRYVDAETVVKVSDSNMLQDLIDYGYEVGSNDYKALISTDLIKSYEFDDVVYSDTGCTRHMFLVLSALEGVDLNYDVDFKYDYVDGVWETDYINAYRASESFNIEDSLLGSYEGIVTCGDEEEGAVKLVMESYDPEENDLTGYIQYVTEGDFADTEVIAFTASYIAYDWQFSVEFEKKIYFKKYTGKNRINLYVDPADGNLKTSSSESIQIEIWKQ